MDIHRRCTATGATDPRLSFFGRTPQHAGPAISGPIDLAPIDAGALQRILDQVSINEFLASTRAVKPRLEDARIQRKLRKLRELREPAVRSMGWFATEDDWLRASTHDGACSSVIPSEASCDAGAELGDDPESWDCYVVERRPRVTEACEVSGEVFKVEYNVDLDKWILRDAVVVSGKDAQRLRVPDGSLVKVNCIGRAALPLYKSKRIKYGPSMGSEASPMASS
jgi:hypothetical protein